MRANESVAVRIEELRARNAEKCQLSRDEAIQYLVEILKTPIAEVTADHRLAQSYDAKSGKIELPNSFSKIAHGDYTFAEICRRGEDLHGD